MDYSLNTFKPRNFSIIDLVYAKIILGIGNFIQYNDDPDKSANEFPDVEIEVPEEDRERFIYDRSYHQPLRFNTRRNG